MIFLELFIEFFLIGLFTFGGGYAMIPLVKDLVIEKAWLTEEAFYNFLGVCESTPGPIAINMATYVGSTQGGVFGSVCATLGVVLPSFIIIVLIAIFLKKFIKNKYFQYFLKGIKPVILGLILSAGLMLIVKAIGYESLQVFNLSIQSIIVIVCLLISLLVSKYVFKKKMNNILFIVLSAVFGIVVCLII